MKQFVFFISLIFATLSVSAQDKKIKVKKFKDGIYLNLQKFQQQKPIGIMQIYTQEQYDDMFFFEEITKHDTIRFYDNLGSLRKIATKNIWGYSQRGNLFINLHDDFNRVLLLGELSYFNAKVTYEYFSAPNVYSFYHSQFHDKQTKTELKEYILNINTGDIYPLEPKSIKELLSRNAPTLKEEYEKLSNRKQRKLMLLYLRKYNSLQNLQ